MFDDSSGWLTDSPWLSTFRCLAAGGVTLFFCQRPVSLPWWGRGASGFLGPAGFCIFTMWTPVSGRDCSSSVLDHIEDFPSTWWAWFLAFVLGSPSSGWSCVLRPAIVPVAIPPSRRIGPAPSHWVPLPGARCVWGLQPFAQNGGVASDSPVYSFGMWSPFGSSVSFRHS